MGAPVHVHMLHMPKSGPDRRPERGYRLSGSGEHDVEDGHLDPILRRNGEKERRGSCAATSFQQSADNVAPPRNRINCCMHGSLTNMVISRSIIVAYAPTNEATDSDKDRFYDKLNATAQTVGLPPHGELLTVGDLNAVLGEARIGSCWPILSRLNE